jgi:hypothetical protein
MLTLTATLYCGAATQAQHSDVEFSYGGGIIDIEFGAEGRGFESDFPTSGLFARHTDDPGFASEVAEGLGIGPGDLIGYNILSPLQYWDGSSFVALPSGAMITIDDAFSSTTVGSGLPGDAIASFGANNNVIDVAGGGGDFHSHVDFTLSEFLTDGLTPTPFGGYGFVASLSTDAGGVGDSDPFGLFFNYGLSEPQFEAGFDAFLTTNGLDSAAVPEPSTYGFMAIGLVGLAIQRRRRKKQPVGEQHSLSSENN